MEFLNELFGLKGKTAVVIGGGGVLAGFMAEGLARAGANVAVLDLNLESAQKKANELTLYGVKTLAVQIDASQKNDFIDAEKQLLEVFDQINIVINAPGINSATPFFEISEEEWAKILNVNLKSIFLSSQVFAERMINQGKGGSIINISSASSGPPLSKVFSYGISKAGINNMTQFLAREFAPHNIRVNALAPGFFPAEQNRKILTKERTESIFNHTAMKRFGNPEELIGATLWLASDKASSFVTGSIIRIDGGFSAMTI